MRLCAVRLCCFFVCVVSSPRSLRKDGSIAFAVNDSFAIQGICVKRDREQCQFGFLWGSAVTMKPGSASGSARFAPETVGRLQCFDATGWWGSATWRSSRNSTELGYAIGGAEMTKKRCKQPKLELFIRVSDLTARSGRKRDAGSSSSEVATSRPDWSATAGNAPFWRCQAAERGLGLCPSRHLHASTRQLRSNNVEGEPFERILS